MELGSSVTGVVNERRKKKGEKRGAKTVQAVRGSNGSFPRNLSIDWAIKSND